MPLKRSSSVCLHACIERTPHHTVRNRSKRAKSRFILRARHHRVPEALRRDLRRSSFRGTMDNARHPGSRPSLAQHDWLGMRFSSAGESEATPTGKSGRQHHHLTPALFESSPPGTTGPSTDKARPEARGGEHAARPAQARTLPETAPSSGTAPEYPLTSSRRKRMLRIPRSSLPSSPCAGPRTIFAGIERTARKQGRARRQSRASQRLKTHAPTCRTTVQSRTAWRVERLKRSSRRGRAASSGRADDPG